MQFDIAAGAKLSLMTFHHLDPADAVRADVDADFRPAVRRLAAVSDRIFQMVLDGVCGKFAQFRQPAVTRQPRAVSAKVTNDDMIRVLIDRSDGGKEDVGTKSANPARDREVVRR